MPYIEMTYDLPLPNEYLVDHSFSEGKTREATYHGPDKLWLHIDKETGVEKYGPLTAEDIADGRPVPADCYLYELDCTKYPLIAQLRAPVINELQEDFTGRVIHPESPVVEGYPQYSYGVPLKPQDVFNKFSVRIVDNVPIISAFTVAQRLFDKEHLLTWDEIRSKRDKELETSDGQLPFDAPDSLKEEFMSYRQLLRDLPTKLQEANVPAHIAFFMFPEHPHARKATKLQI